MTKLVRVFPHQIVSNAAAYIARAYGERRSDGLWEGWLEFADQRTGEVLLTGRETTQSNFSGLGYWANGIGRAYLQGGLERARRRFGVSIVQRGLV